MKENPDIFAGLVFQYVITASTPARRTINIDTSAISKSQMFSKLKNMPNVTDSIRYLSATDVNKMVTQSLDSVVASEITDNTYVSGTDEVNVAEMLRTNLQNQQEHVKSLDDIRWESVFWDPIFMRPDKLVNELNNKYTKDEENSETLRIKEGTNNVSAGGGIDIGLPKGFTFGIKAQGSKGKGYKSELKDINKKIRETNAQVEWNGEKFFIKPMSVSRVNLAELETGSSIGVANVQVSSYETEHTIPVKVGKMANLTSYLSPQLVEARLLEKMNELEKEMTNNGTALRVELKRESDSLKTEAEDLRKELKHTVHCLLRGLVEPYQTGLNEARKCEQTARNLDIAVKFENFTECAHPHLLEACGHGQ